VQKALTKQDPSLTEVSRLATDTPEGAFRRTFARAVAANLERIATQSSAQWHSATDFPPSCWHRAKTILATKP
jgi:hypothetical protein